MWNRIHKFRAAIQDARTQAEAAKENCRMIEIMGAAAVGKVAINALPVNGSWGGGNQWLVQLSRHLRYLGFAVVYDLADDDIDAIFVMHSSPQLGGTFDRAAIATYQRAHPKVKCIHRINENDARKGTSHMDADIQRMNEVADHTVFISDWLRAYHQAKWFRPERAHSVIINGADSRFFHPIGGQRWRRGENLILVTHHWSDHWNKGFAWYSQVDQLITEGKLKNTELWVVGRWPKELKWKSARTFAPCAGPDLAKILRNAHAYLTASQAEPGGMHFIEGLQCGLPLLYHSGGGGIVEVGKATGGISFAENAQPAIEALRESYAARRAYTLTASPTGERMTTAYLEVLMKALTQEKDEK